MRATTNLLRNLLVAGALYSLFIQPIKAEGVLRHPVRDNRTIATRALSRSATHWSNKARALSLSSNKAHATKNSSALPVDWAFKSVDVYPHGTYADIHISLTQRRGVFLQVSDTPPVVRTGFYKQDLVFFNKGKTYYVTTSPEEDTFRVLRIYEEQTPLRPNQTYYYALQVAADKGYHVYTGSFRTWNRWVTVYINQIHITDDSDPTGSGELQFSFFINRQFIGAVPPLHSGDLDLGSGTTLNMGNNFFLLPVKNVPGKVFTVKATGFDYDENGLNFFPIPHASLPTCGRGGIASPDFANGTDECGEWSSGGMLLRLDKANGDAYRTGPNENFGGPFFIKARSGSGSELEFEVTGKYEVMFSPA